MKVIGICGPSCSGKSSIAKELSKILDCNRINVYQYYKLGSDKIYVEYEGNKIRTFERPELYDGDMVAQIIRELKINGKATVKRLLFEGGKEVVEEILEEKQHIIVEGFHVLNYESLSKEIDVSFYVDIDFEEIKRRRMQRSDRGQKDEDFLKIGNEEWMKYGEPQKEKANYILDGMKNTAQLVKEIMEKIK